MQPAPAHTLQLATASLLLCLATASASAWAQSLEGEVSKGGLRVVRPQGKAMPAVHQTNANPRVIDIRAFDLDAAACGAQSEHARKIFASGADAQKTLPRPSTSLDAVTEASALPISMPPITLEPRLIPPAFDFAAIEQSYASNIPQLPVTPPQRADLRNCLCGTAIPSAQCMAERTSLIYGRTYSQGSFSLIGGLGHHH